MSYERTFLVNGPIIKVYQNAEDSVSGSNYDQQKLKYTLDLPPIKDSYGNQVTP